LLQKINNFSGRTYWLLALVVFSLSRLATWLFPFDSDHWIFYYVGRRWAQGGTLYLDMWDHKSPLIYAYNGLLYRLFGSNIVLHRIFFTIIALAALWLFYKSARLLYEQLKLKSPVLLARVSTLVFAFIANLAEFTNSGNNNENLGLLFLTATLYLYLRWRENPANKRQFLFFSGLTAGFVIMLKINFFILLLPILIDMIIISRKNLYKLISNLCFSLLGTLLQILIWFMYFVHVGTFKQFYIATFQFNGKYMSALGWDIHSPGIIIFIGLLGLLLLFFAPFVIKSWWSWYKNRTNNNFLVGVLSASSLIFMIMAGTFYSHYFLIALPLLCLVFGATFNDVIKFKPRLLTACLTIVAFLLLLGSLKQLYNSFSGSVKAEANNQVAVAKYIDAHTGPTDKIFAYVYGATIYQLANRDSGSRFVSASHLLIDNKYNFGYDFNRQFIDDMVNSEAKYIIMFSDTNNIYRKQNDVAMRFINNNYHFEASLAGYDILAINTE
jgi:4-amino-4-deoxy-L-arabinose transferase-like glycosyltransferase